MGLYGDRLYWSLRVDGKFELSFELYVVILLARKEKYFFLSKGQNSDTGTAEIALRNCPVTKALPQSACPVFGTTLWSFMYVTSFPLGFALETWIAFFLHSLKM